MLKRKESVKFVAASVVVGICCALLGTALKMFTEHYEGKLFLLAQNYIWCFFLFPLVGLSGIYLLRLYLFKGKENKGIKEIFDTLKTRHNDLPIYKIPSHFINGFLTIIFGGSSGIEVSSVVASASAGYTAQKKMGIHNLYRKELICAGVAAAVTVLFNSPVAGALFALEVILRKVSRTALISILISVSTVTLISWLIDAEPLFHVHIDHWNISAFPYFILLGIFAGLHSVYLTKCVLFFKSKFSKINKHYYKIVFAAFLMGLCLLLFPQLYGEGYQAMNNILQHSEQWKISYAFVFMLLGILILKPVVTALTLSSGGDGGVFAPSLFIGAFLGLLLALMLNYFHLNVIPLNFMLIGMAAVLSASLHAPFTAVFLLCGAINDYTLIVPVLAACVVAKFTAKIILPYTIYSYSTEIKA